MFANLKNGFDVRPGLNMSTRHQRGSISSTFFPARDARTNVVNALFAKKGATACCISVLRIATINDDITFLQQVDQLIDK